MVLAFMGFLRCGEFRIARNAGFNLAIHLTCSSVEFIPDMDSATHI